MWSLEDPLVSLQPLFLFCQYHSSIKPLEQVVIPYAYRRTTGRSYRTCSKRTTNRSVVIGPPTQNKKSSDSELTVRSFRSSTAKPVVVKKNHKNKNTKGGPEDFHLLEELVRTRSVAVVHFSSTSVGCRSIDIHSRQQVKFGSEGSGLHY